MSCMNNLYLEIEEKLEKITPDFEKFAQEDKEVLIKDYFAEQGDALNDLMKEGE